MNVCYESTRLNYTLFTPGTLHGPSTAKDHMEKNKQYEWENLLESEQKRAVKLQVDEKHKANHSN